MIYDKFPVVFLSTVASEKKDSTNSQIATYILGHLDNVQNIGIREMAAECSVAVSSISRFCKDIGLRDFAELKELLLSTDLHFEEYSPGLSGGERLQDYGRKVKDSIEMVERSIDLKMVNDLCEDILRYRKVAVFGLLKAGAVALNLQCDLLMLGKQVYTNISYRQQMEYILSADERDLIIIFSYTGSYFRYQDSRDLNGLKGRRKGPRIWMITGRAGESPPFADRVITFRSPQDQNGHPYQLQFAAGLIAQEYARKCRLL